MYKKQQTRPTGFWFCYCRFCSFSSKLVSPVCTPLEHNLGKAVWAAEIDFVFVFFIIIFPPPKNSNILEDELRMDRIVYVILEDGL